MSRQALVDAEVLERIKLFRPYVEAKLGFRNHWYPIAFSQDVQEEAPKPLEILGEKVLLNRIDGKIYAIRDRCIHRGVPLSRKIECYTKGTITCWYHGFTYRFSDGQLIDIVGTNGESALIGESSIKSFPIEEAKGIVFIFVGDEGRELPPLAHDVPPMFLDPDMEIRGKSRLVNANWRLGAENGFDSMHIFIHKSSILLEDNDLAMPLGLLPTGEGSFMTEEADDGPKGVYDNFGPDSVIPVFEGKIDGDTVLHGRPQGQNMLPHSISLWLPGVLRVHPWPDPSLTQFEWYVPLNETQHLYFQTLGRRVKTDDDVAAFHEEFEKRWVPVALNGFNDDDIWAREATQPFYEDDWGWIDEQLFEPDENLIEWRKLASKHNRGIQRRENLR